MQQTGTSKPKDFWMTVITAGIIIGALEVFVELSFASLVFSGDLAPLLPAGVGLFLLGSIVSGIVVLFTSSIPGMISVPQDGPAAILALTSAHVLLEMAPTSTNDQLYYTILSVIMAASLATGLVFLLFGWLKWGNLVRYIPYPVIGGFLAGTGWLLVIGSVSIMTDISLNLSTLPSIFGSAVLIHWLPGFALAIVLMVVLLKTGNIRYLVILLLGGFALFYLVVFIADIPMQTIREGGYLLGPFSEGIQWKPLLPDKIQYVSWEAFSEEFWHILIVVVMSVNGLLLNASGIELVAHADADLNRELRSNGLANLLSGILGGPTGYATTSLSALSLKMGYNTNWVGVVSILFISGTFFFGAGLISYFPKMVLGGLVLFIGLDILWEWVVRTWKSLPRNEWIIILVILLVIVNVGFLEGVGVGILLAVVLFVINYSRVNVVRNQLDGQVFHSSTERPYKHHQLLDDSREGIYILKLQGYIFFGTAHHVYQAVSAHMVVHSHHPLHYLILDFRHVSRLDSSAMNSFKKITYLAQKRDFKVLYSNLNPAVRSMLRTNQLIDVEPEETNTFLSIDHAVEWCEDDLLSDMDAAETQPARSLPHLLAAYFQHEKIDFNGLMNFLDKVELPAGDVLIRQGQEQEYLYFIESGYASIYLEDVESHAEQVRIGKRGPGTILGELSFFLEYPATAMVSLDTDGVVYRLSRAQIAKMDKTDATTAANLRRLITHLLGDRLAKTTGLLQAMLD